MLLATVLWKKYRLLDVLLYLLAPVQYHRPQHNTTSFGSVFPRFSRAEGIEHDTPVGGLLIVNAPWKRQAR